MSIFLVFEGKDSGADPPDPTQCLTSLNCEYIWPAGFAAGMELDTPEYLGRVKGDLIVEKQLAKGGSKFLSNAEPIVCPMVTYLPDKPDLNMRRSSILVFVPSQSVSPRFSIPYLTVRWSTKPSTTKPPTLARYLHLSTGSKRCRLISKYLVRVGSCSQCILILLVLLPLCSWFFSESRRCIHEFVFPCVLQPNCSRRLSCYRDSWSTLR